MVNFKVDLSFLPAGKYNMDAWADGINAYRMASDYKQTTSRVVHSSTVKTQLAPGGGDAWCPR